MEDKKELQELLERLDQSNRQQAKYARWQLRNDDLLLVPTTQRPNCLRRTAATNF